VEEPEKIPCAGRKLTKCKGIRLHIQELQQTKGNLSLKKMASARKVEANLPGKGPKVWP